MDTIKIKKIGAPKSIILIVLNCPTVCAVVHLKVIDEIVNSADPDQTAPLGAV